MIATRALALAGTHRPEDIAEGVACGQMQQWGDEDCVIVTEIRATPLAKYLHFFLAEGHMAGLRAMIPAILDWARACGCTRASLVGREGWRRVPWLLESGWRFKEIVMEREL
jgi:hypothetical protein